jgi:hypothetical protein
METQDEPYYLEIDSVYHVLTSCPLGRRIPAELRRPGHGGRELCPACEARLDRRPRLDSAGE